MKGVDAIPVHVQAFAREFAALATKHGLSRASVTLRPGFSSRNEWDSDINISWETGRHGEDRREFRISTTINVHATVGREEFQASLEALDKAECR